MSQEYEEEVIKWTCNKCNNVYYLGENVGMADCDCGADDWNTDTDQDKEIELLKDIIIFLFFFLC